MHLFAIISHIRLQDVIDILFLAAVAYHLYLWFQGTKALKALIGLAALGMIYTVAQLWGLFLTTWMFQILWQVLIILLIILFQSEIRQVLERINPLRAFGWRRNFAPAEWIRNFSEGCFMLAKRSIGALIILERSDNAEEWFTGGMALEAIPGPELLQSIFQKGSLLHDGAVLIRGGRVVLVGAYLPLSSAEELPKTWGTRHRAAIGLSER
ncbi:MAG: DNA integrity scanning protein DisA nucleotide-binding domain protein [Deltaproteobacteria bacterium]|nr:DNA integrity scanning protein DisA nucleotide-binding domain protein [Deltaproteobacteria bacterium]MBW1993096.1 DNA integrity scanning protein DisA nucleotide-binding domain protein [Deltaproteobacteria bacterium]MBW2152825.1 DNA integrity scanning protein DisA nucleotide-binding domain protein [Deltaproteobacteria bacterium]